MYYKASLYDLLGRFKIIDGVKVNHYDFRFPGPIQAAHFNPRDETKIIVCPLKAAPLILGIRYERKV